MPPDHPLAFLLRFLKKSVFMAGYSILLSSATILLGVGLMGTSAYLISYAALQPSIAALNVAIVGVRFFGISKSVFRYLERLTSHDVNFRLLEDLRVWIYKQLIERIPSRKDATRSGDLMARLVEDVEVLEFFFIRVINPPLTAILTILVVGFFLGTIDHSLIGIYLGLAFASWLLMLVISFLAAKQSSRQYVNIRAEVHAETADILDGLGDILMHQQLDNQLAAYHQAEEAYRKTQMQVATTSGWINALLVLLTQGSMVGMLIAGISLTAQGAIPGLLLATIPLITIASFDAMQPLNLAAQQYYLSSQAAFRIQELTSKHDTRPPQPNETIKAAAQQDAVLRSIQLRQVSFQYEEGGSEGLFDISIEITPGKKIAIVGPSGAGKTTLARLLMGIQAPSAGTILLNGQPYQEYAQEFITAITAYTGPSPYFLNASLRENFQFFVPSITDEEIRQALQHAQMSAWLEGLGSGLDTPAGERGLKMSEGERRRLDLARMLVLKRPVLILDEPFANQDIEHQRMLSRQIHLVAENTALVMITHRLMDLEQFDEIVVLEQGRIADRGSYVRLKQREGLFQRMLAQQQELIFERGISNG